MNTEASIFDSAPPQDGEFKKWEKISDEVQGTYIDTRDGVDTYGNDQRIYVLRDKEGKVWNVAFKKTNTVILDRMEGVRLGQIIGFRYEEDRPSKAMPGTTAKIIRIYQSPSIVDRAWLAEQEEIKKTFGTVDVGTNGQSFDAPLQPQPTTVDDTSEAVAPGTPEATVDVTAPAEEVSTEQTPLQAIRSLAVTQRLNTADMPEAEQDASIVNFAGISLVKDNYTDIIIKLTNYKK